MDQRLAQAIIREASLKDDWDHTMKWSSYTAGTDTGMLAEPNPRMTYMSWPPTNRFMFTNQSAGPALTSSSCVLDNPLDHVMLVCVS